MIYRSVIRWSSIALLDYQRVYIYTYILDCLIIMETKTTTVVLPLYRMELWIKWALLRPPLQPAGTAEFCSTIAATQVLRSCLVFEPETTILVIKFFSRCSWADTKFCIYVLVVAHIYTIYICNFVNIYIYTYIYNDLHKQNMHIYTNINTYAYIHMNK